MLVDTTMEAVEEREEGKVTTDKVKFLKMPYKGATHPTIVRETGHKKSKVSCMSRFILIKTTETYGLYTVELL